MDLLQSITSLDLEKHLLILLFFIPGFISIKVYDLFIIPGEKRDFSKSFIDAFVYSSINFLLSSWLIYLNIIYEWYKNCFILFAISFIVTIFILPALLPVAFHKLTLSTLLVKYRKIHPVPVAWDFVFGKRERFWVIVHLKNGRLIGGFYGAQSFASSFPNPEQIFLEELWELDKKDRFKKALYQSAGAWIPREEISTLEFFHL
jgi:hypothetical protein